MKHPIVNIRKIAVAAALAAASLSVVAPASAAGPTGSYQSEIVCGNLDTITAANVQIQYYSESGTLEATFVDPSELPANQSRVYAVTAPSGFKGAAVVSANVEMACTVNLSKSGVDGSEGNPARSAASESVASANVGQTLFASQVVKTLGNASSGIYNSYFSVQNTDTTDVQVDIVYTDRFGASVNSAFSAGQRTIKPSSAKVFYLEDDTAVGVAFTGGVKVTGPSGAKLAGTVVMFNDGSVRSKGQLLSYNMVTAGANKLTVPQFTVNYFGFNSGFNVQNIDNIDATVNVAFSMANGQTYVEGPITLSPGKVYAPFAPNIAALAPMRFAPTGQRTGSAIITSTGGKVVSNVNLRHDGVCYLQAGESVDCTLGGVGANNTGTGTAFLAFADGTATTKIFIPDYRKNVGGALFTSGLKVVNSTNTPTTCDVSFPADTGASANIVGQSLPASGAFDLFAGAGVMANLDDGYSNSVVINCGQPAFSNFNMRSQNAGFLGDATTTANAVNLP